MQHDLCQTACSSAGMQIGGRIWAGHTTADASAMMRSRWAGAAWAAAARAADCAICRARVLLLAPGPGVLCPLAGTGASGPGITRTKPFRIVFSDKQQMHQNL